MAVVFRGLQTETGEIQDIGVFIGGEFYGKESLAAVIKSMETEGIDPDILEDELVEQWNGVHLNATKADDSEINVDDFRELSDNSTTDPDPV